MHPQAAGVTVDSNIINNLAANQQMLMKSHEEIIKRQDEMVGMIQKMRLQDSNREVPRTSTRGMDAKHGRISRIKKVATH